MTTTLTIGFATSDDWSGAYFTLQAARLMAEADGVAHRVRYVVVDNGQSDETSERLRGVCNGAGATYERYTGVLGTAAPRNRVFELAATDAVVCVDSHVLFRSGALRALLDYYDSDPDCRDLISGPLLYDSMGDAVATHFSDNWGGGMWGQWARHESYRPDGEPFEIPAMGLGLFSCMRDAWLGFNEHFREFGGEEWYIHEKYRKAGRKCICIPQLQWVHRFGHPDCGRRSPTGLHARVRNYVIGLQEVGIDLSRCYQHFVHELPAGQRITQQQWDAIVSDPLAYPPATVKLEQPVAVVAKPCCQSATPQKSYASLADWYRDKQVDINTNALRLLASAVMGDPIRTAVYGDTAGSVSAVVAYLLNAGYESIEPTLFVISDRPPAWLQQLQSLTAGLPVSVECALVAVADLAIVTESIELMDKVRSNRALIIGPDDKARDWLAGWLLDHSEWSVINTDTQDAIYLSRIDNDKPVIADVATQAASVARAVVNATKTIASGEPVLLTSEQTGQRLRVCSLCPSRNDDRCAECGCYLKRKASLATEDCPKGRWPNE